MSIYDDVAELEKKLDNCYDLETGEIDEKAEAQILVAMQELFEDGLEKLCKIRANLLDGNKRKHYAELSKYFLEFIASCLLYSVAYHIRYNFCAFFIELVLIIYEFVLI